MCIVGGVACGTGHLAVLGAGEGRGEGVSGHALVAAQGGAAQAEGRACLAHGLGVEEETLTTVQAYCVGLARAASAVRQAGQAEPLGVD